MSKWTPGPWFERGFQIREDGGALVAEAWSGIPADAVDASQLNRAEAQHANARLIAAAPEMVEMLQLALATDHMDEDDPLFVSSRDRIRALLARLEAE